MDSKKVDWSHQGEYFLTVGEGLKHFSYSPCLPDGASSAAC
jgi:hypothetical protein